MLEEPSPLAAAALGNVICQTAVEMRRRGVQREVMHQKLEQQLSMQCHMNPIYPRIYELEDCRPISVSLSVSVPGPTAHKAVVSVAILT